jgi:hypothetical protein
MPNEKNIVNVPLDAPQAETSNPARIGILGLFSERYKDGPKNYPAGPWDPANAHFKAAIDAIGKSGEGDSKKSIFIGMAPFVFDNDDDVQGWFNGTSGAAFLEACGGRIIYVPVN